MIILSFYKECEDSWEKLQNTAINIIEHFQKASIDTEYGYIPHQQEYEDYKEAVGMGLKTFILEVLNEWDVNFDDYIYLDKKIYKEFKEIEIDGIFNDELNILKKIKTRDELLKILKKENISLSDEEFEMIYEIYDSDEEIIADIIEFKYSTYEASEFGEFEGRLIDNDDYDDFDLDNDYLDDEDF